MSEHTKEPWEAYTNCPGECCWLIKEKDGDNFFQGITHPETTEANARRIVACVNACADISSEKLQSWMNPPRGSKGAPHGPWTKQLIDLQERHNDLLAELKNIADAHRFNKEHFENDASFADWAQSRARHAIAKEERHA